MKRLIILVFIIGNIFSVYSQTAKTAIPIVIPNRITGTWELVSVTNSYPNGNIVYPYGVNPRGLLIFDATGTYALQIYKAARLTVASGDKNNCTAQENAALVQGSNSHFGKYVVDDIDHTITFHIEYASFPNWNYNQQKRVFSFTDNQLQYIVTNTTQGGGSVVAKVVWKRKP